MNPFDREVSEALKGLGKQVEAQVPPGLYQVARLVGAGAAASPRVQRQRVRIGKVVEVAAACLLLGSLVGVAAYRNVNGAGAESKAGACGYRQTIGENLALAAERLPVPSASISRRYDSDADGSRRKVAWPAEWETHLRQQQEQGRLGYSLIGDEVHLSTWGSEGGKLQPINPTSTFTEYRFPRGGLSEQSNVAQIFAQFNAAAESGDMKTTVASSIMWQVSQDQYYRDRLGARDWTLKDVLRWYDTDMSSPTCVTKTVPEFRNGPVAEMTLPMLDLHNGRYVGFRGDSIITTADNEGLFGGGTKTNWYTVPGLLPTDQLSGKPARKPVQSKAQVKQQEADRKAKEAQLPALRAEIADAEARYKATGEGGMKLKELGLRMGQLLDHINNPMSDEVRLEKELERARVVLTNKVQLAALDPIERDFKSGAKPVKLLLLEVEAVLNM